MPEKWTGDLLGRMHNLRITRSNLAEELGVSKSYISFIFSGKRTPPYAQKRLEAAVDRIIEKRKEVLLLRRFRFKTKDETRQKEVAELLEKKQLGRDEVYLLLSTLEISRDVSEQDM